MNYKVTAQRLTYHGLSKHPMGGWEYTVKELGAIECPPCSVNECERQVRTKFPKANRLRIYFPRADGTLELGFSGYC